MVRIVVALVDDESPDDKAEASIDAKVLEKCETQADIRRLVGNMFLTLIGQMLENEPAEGERLELHETIKTKL